MLALWFCGMKGSIPPKPNFVPPWWSSNGPLFRCEPWFCEWNTVSLPIHSSLVETRYISIAFLGQFFFNSHFPTLYFHHPSLDIIINFSQCYHVCRDFVIRNKLSFWNQLFASTLKSHSIFNLYLNLCPSFRHEFFFQSAICFLVRTIYPFLVCCVILISILLHQSTIGQLISTNLPLVLQIVSLWFVICNTLFFMLENRFIIFDFSLVSHKTISFLLFTCQQATCVFLLVPKSWLISLLWLLDIDSSCYDS